MTALPHDNDEPDDDARPRLSRRAWWAVGIGIAVLTALASVWGWWMAKVPVRWQDVGYSIDSATAATATYDVFFYTDHLVECHLHAMNDQFAEVGALSVTIDPANGKQQRISTTVATTETATTVVVTSCEVAP